MKRHRYREGDVVAVPLKSGGFGVGVISRVSSRGKIVFGYFFPQKFENSEEICDFENMKPEKSILQLRFGDLGIINGEWRIVGQIPGWNKDDWPMIVFARKDDISKLAWKVTYDDNDPSVILLETPMSYENADFPRDSLYGYGAVEAVLSRNIEARC